MKNCGIIENKAIAILLDTHEKFIAENCHKNIEKLAQPRLSSFE